MWLVEGMEENTLIWVPDKSYNRKKVSTVSRAGWIVYFKKTNKSLAGTFYNISSSAGSYGAKQLGWCAIHILLSALTTCFKVNKWRTKVCCDNQGELYIAARKLRRIWLVASCANILRSIRSSSNNTKVSIIYKHLNGHSDK